MEMCIRDRQRHLVAEVDGVDDGVGVLVFHFGQAVNGRDEDVYKRQPLGSSYSPQSSAFLRVYPAREDVGIVPYGEY